ncbi:MAG: hypothetical protein GY822_06650 [Deltaproteobacteria bacterium]|nr:hypothetical protein [Deltaproteobacteria bacterium]
MPNIHLFLIRCCAAFALFSAACATAPTYRAPIPLERGKSVEAGAGVHIGGGVEVQAAGVQGVDFKGGTVLGGGSAFVLYRIPQTEFYVFGAGQGTGILGVAGDLGMGGIGGGQAGFRMDYEIVSNLWISGELYADYQYVGFVPSSDPYHQVSGVAALVVAERLTPGVWIYARPTMGIGLPIPLLPSPYITQVAEIPVGIHYTVNEFFSLRAEGGYHVYRNGLVLGAAAILRF